VNRLSTFALGDVELQQFLRYEECLWELERLNYNAIEALLPKWNPDKTDPIWALRKAGIFAETDHDEEAVKLVQGALAQIRRYRRRDIDDYAALSREGWALWFVWAYTDGFPANPHLADEVSPWDRWRALSPYDCDARSDYYSLQAELERYAPTPNSRVTTSAGFDLGRASHSVHFRSGLPTGVLSACQAIRISEVTGLPHAFNHASIFRTALEKAIVILEDSDPLATSLRALRMADHSDDNILNELFREPG
jgi:hypothetical protein